MKQSDARKNILEFKQSEFDNSLNLINSELKRVYDEVCRLSKLGISSCILVEDSPNLIHRKDCIYIAGGSIVCDEICRILEDDGYFIYRIMDAGWRFWKLWKGVIPYYDWVGTAVNMSW